MRARLLPGHVRMSICENDKHGNPSGRVSAITVEDMTGQEECLSLEHHHWFAEGTPFIQSAGRLISVHGYDFKYSDRHTWVGNIMWNEYALPATYAVGLLNVLHRSREWQPESGYTTLLGKWAMADGLTCADLGFTDILDSDQVGIGFHRSGQQLILFWSDKPVD